MAEPTQGSGLRKPGAAVDRVIDTIVTRIGSGELGPGEQLRQEDLAETLGFSRVPVREALHALTEQGVLVHLKHRGFFVAKRTPGELVELARLIELIEDEVLTAAVWPDDEVLARLRALNQHMLAIADDYDPAETLTLNREFHFAVFLLSPRRIMIDELERLWRLAQPFIAAGMITSDARHQRVVEHQDIIAQLEKRDRNGLRAAMQRHRRRSERGTGTAAPAIVSDDQGASADEATGQRVLITGSGI
jgi:DNA-binding GntR family transcriptional regulator